MRPEAYSNCRFYVDIGEETVAVFTEVSGIQVEIATIDVEEGGRNDHVHRLPGRARVGNVQLKRGMTTTHWLYKWCMDVARGKIMRRNVTITMFDTRGQELVRWSFLNAYPVKWIAPALNGAHGAAAVETLELAHEGLAHD